VSLRIGIVGAGLWTERAHLPAFRRASGATVHAIADLDRPRAQRLAGLFDVPHVTADYRDLLAKDVQAVAVVTPDDVHHEIAVAALEAGLPVLCEKPLARTVAEARDLARRAAAAGVVTKMGFVFRYSPALGHLAELVRAGRVGRIHSIVVYSQNPQFMSPGTALHWKMERARTGGGVFVEYGSHSLDLARWLVGEPVAICGQGVTVVPERARPDGGRVAVDVDDVCSWLVAFAGGAEGLFHASWASLPQPWGDLAVFGDRGVLVWRRRDDEWPFAELFEATLDEPALRAVAVPATATAGLEWATTWRECFMGALARRFVAEVTGAAPAEGPTFEDGYRVQLALDALATSLAERRWVAIP
jgi:predicted dehydrogenase